MTTESPDSHLSMAEIVQALHGLSDSDHMRLRRLGRWLARTHPVSADDLMQETCLRAINGQRKCPRDVKFIKFVAETMRGLASDAAKAQRRRPEIHLDSVDDLTDYEASPEQQMIEAEWRAQATETKRQLLDLFKDDLVAMTILEGDMEGLQGEDLRVLTNLNKTEFASKRRAIRRAIAKAFGKPL